MTTLSYYAIEFTFPPKSKLLHWKMSSSPSDSTFIVYQGLCCVLGTHDSHRNCPCPDDAYNWVRGNHNKQRKKCRKDVIASSANCYMEKSVVVESRVTRGLLFMVVRQAFLVTWYLRVKRKSEPYKKTKVQGCYRYKNSSCKSLKGGKNLAFSWKWKGVQCS